MGLVCDHEIGLTFHERHERATLAAEWIIANVPEKTFGVEPTLLPIVDSGRNSEMFEEEHSLCMFEDFGRRGNAVLLHESAFGGIWWCDPEGRKTDVSYFALCRYRNPYVDYEIRFVKS
jgi:hypothetical protein